MSNPVTISSLHKEHRVWEDELNFWEDELIAYKKVLAEVISKGQQNADVLAQSERFQNQFIRHQEIIDILKHDVRRYEKFLASHVHDQDVTNSFPDHPMIRDRVDVQRKMFDELKYEFKVFASAHRHL